MMRFLNRRIFHLSHHRERIWRLEQRSCSSKNTPPEDDFRSDDADILHDLFSGEPLHLRVDQISRDQEMMMTTSSQTTDGSQSTGTVLDDAEVFSPNRMTSLARSKQYFPKPEKAARASTLNHLKMDAVIRSYKSFGHLDALIDPLYINRKPMQFREFPSPSVLKQSRAPVDWDTLYLLPNDTSLGGGYQTMKLGKLMRALNSAYCGSIGVEFIHIPELDCRIWIRDRIETIELRHMSNDLKILCAQRLIETSIFSDFLQHKAGTLMRYSIEGSETSILGLYLLVQRAAIHHGVQTFIYGSRRLSRFSIMESVLDVQPSHIFHLLATGMKHLAEMFNLGIVSTSPSESGDENLSHIMVASPLIPESFFPIVLGMTKAIQKMKGDEDGDKVWPIVIHMAKGLNSQGIVYETLKLSLLPEFNTHGTIHLVFNNQMEHTLSRETSLSSEYCTDVLRTIHSPVFHVNGDDLAAVNFTLCMAADYRAKFKRDVVVEIVSYSRSMLHRTVTNYELIRVQQAVRQTKPFISNYLEQLKKSNIINDNMIDKWKTQKEIELARDWHNVMTDVKPDVDRDIWTPQINLSKIKQNEKNRTIDFDTGVSRETLEELSKKLIAEPKDFEISPKQSDILQKRANLLQKDTLDWVLCEALAFGTLLLEIKGVRISGMDVNRRFHIIRQDKLEGNGEYSFLNNLSPIQGKYYLCTTTTSQYASAGFEYGYSTADLDTLVIWEAPEGDKTSKAQVIIDNFIAGGYVKYNYHSNIIFLLPHYLKCENVSKVCNGRPERFLQLVNNYENQIETDVDKQLKDTNMIIANVSSPANYFHIIRRQMYLPYRRPLMIFTPNLISSHPNSKAQLYELMSGTRFQPFIPDNGVDPKEAVKVLFCTGKIYHDLIIERKVRGLEGKVAINRIEQICPLPYQMIIDYSKRYTNITQDVAWIQEEPINQGWWDYIEPRIENIPNLTKIKCIARPSRPDGGSRSMKSCFQEQEQLFEKAFAINN